MKAHSCDIEAVMRTHCPLHRHASAPRPRTIPAAGTQKSQQLSALSAQPPPPPQPKLEDLECPITLCPYTIAGDDVPVIICGARPRGHTASFAGIREARSLSRLNRTLLFRAFTARPPLHSMAML